MGTGTGEKKDILLVEDDRGVAMGIVYALQQEGFRVTGVRSAAEARDRFATGDFALVILDIGLPDGTGFDLCREWRQVSAVPILFLTARDLEIDKVLGLELGGDDYVTKPFGVRELCARVRALIRRARPERVPPGQHLQALDLAIDLEGRRVFRAGERLYLTHTEFELLRHLAGRPGKVFTRDELLSSIWDTAYPGDTKTVDVHVKNLRKKLSEDAPDRQYIETVRGVGYKWGEA